MASLPPLPVPPARGLGKARFLGALAFTLDGVALAGRQFDLIDTDTLVATLLLALLLAAIGVGFAAVGLRDIWRDGRPGAHQLFLSISLIILAFCPATGVGLAYVLTPALDRVATDPVLLAMPVAPSATGLDFLTAKLLVPATERTALQTAAYPDLVSQAVDLSTVEAFALAKTAVEQLGWKVISTGEPAVEGAAGTIDAEARSLVLGLPSAVRIEVRSGDPATRIDIASTSAYPMPDLGENARNIRSFFDAYTIASRRSASP